MTCPVCDHDVECDSAVEWDNGEPAPGSGKWGMSICELCSMAIYRTITPWEYGAELVRRQRRLDIEIAELFKLAEDAFERMGELVRRVP